MGNAMNAKSCWAGSVLWNCDIVSFCAQNDTFDDDEGYDDPYGDDADEGPVY